MYRYVRSSTSTGILWEHNDEPDWDGKQFSVTHYLVNEKNT